MIFIVNEKNNNFMSRFNNSTIIEVNFQIKFNIYNIHFQFVKHMFFFVIFIFIVTLKTIENKAKNDSINITYILFF